MFHKGVKPAKPSTINQSHSSRNKTASLEWSDTAMTWYIDGIEVHRKIRDTDVPASDWPNVPMALVINNGLMESVEKGNTPFPNALILDYMLLYEKD